MKRSNVLFAIVVLAFAMLVSSGCGVYPKFVDIKPNETAFVIPAQGASMSKQAKFSSLDFLKEHKVAAKRIEVPVEKRSTGIMPWSYDEVETVFVIRVDRTPVTRVYTKRANTGTGPKDQGFACESQDSINFTAGAICTIMVEEENTPDFEYHYAGKSLADVADQDVWGFFQASLARQFGELPLSEGRKQKGRIYIQALKEARDQFQKWGITIAAFGNAEGLSYDEKKIQDAIDANFVAQMDIEKSNSELQSQATRNKLNVEKAKADRLVAEEFGKAKDASEAKTRLSNETIDANARAELAKHLSPQILVIDNGGSGAAKQVTNGMLLGLPEKLLKKQ